MRLEEFPCSAIYRIGIGYVILPLFDRWSGRHENGWYLVLWFLGVLLTLRLAPMVLRKVLPFSRELSAVWTERRRLAKRFDSVQWQKLFWIGIGLAGYAAVSGRFDGLGGALTMFCLISGGLGILAWRGRAAV